MLVAKTISVDHLPTGEDYSAPVCHADVAYSAKASERASDVGLTSLELTVIALSHRDPVSSVKPRGRLFSALFGTQSRLALANPRLEALRRYVVLFRLEDSPPDEAGQALRDAGYTSRQIEEIDGRITLPSRKMAARRRLSRITNG